VGCSQKWRAPNDHGGFTYAIALRLSQSILKETIPGDLRRVVTPFLIGHDYNNVISILVLDGEKSVNVRKLTFA